MNQLVAIMLLSLILLTGNCRSNDLCIPVRRDVQDLMPSSPAPIQGRPGKIGPPGIPGSNGAIGPKGVQGECVCDLSVIENKLETMRGEIEVFSIIKNAHYENFCYAGVKDGRVKNQDMAASSFHLNKHYAHFARLDNSDQFPKGYWHPSDEDTKAGAWIQVDFRQPTRIVGVITQGRPNENQRRQNANQWITAYKIAYKNSTGSLEFIQNNLGVDVIFQGNRDRNTHVTNMFAEPVTARYFRLVVHHFHIGIAARMEYLIC